MPPRPRITREMILETALAITKEEGFEAVNARSIAQRMQCSTRPLFTCYDNMEQLKRDLLDFAYQYYEGYVAAYAGRCQAGGHLLLPLSYIAFAREERALFKMLFISDMDLDLKDPEDFYREAGNREKALAFGAEAGLSPERAKKVFLDLFLYAHGIAVLTATQKAALGRESAEEMVARVLSAFLEQAKRDGGAGSPAHS